MQHKSTLINQQNTKQAQQLSTSTAIRLTGPATSSTTKLV